MYCGMISVPGLLNTGGSSPENGAYFDKTIELFNLESKTSCRVNATLDRPRSGHSGHGDLVCGGTGNGHAVISTCYNVITAAIISLNEPRSDHTSWSTDSGVYLLGGQITISGTLLKSVEFINTSTSSGHSRVSGFQLRKSTWYVNRKS